MINLKINIFGKVQGVWFRVHTKEQADKLSLSGFVRNQADGSVYVEVSGEEENINKFLNWIKIGPELSRVDQVNINDNKEVYTGIFTIRHDS